MARIELPDGLTLEQLDRYAEQHAREKRNEYNRQHPDKVLQHRITASANLLRRLGWTVTPPEVPTHE